MGLRDKLKIDNPIVAGALIGALAALLVAAAGHIKLGMSSRGPGVESTGATQGVDLWTYYSMARAVWRSPNGITYAYPYDLYWPAPAVAFQLPITVLAWVGRVTGLPVAFEIGRVAGAAGAGAALGAIGLLFPGGFWRRWFYIAAAMGGSFFTLGALVKAIQVAGWPGLTEIWQYQPHAEGTLFWWLPFLVRNLRMPLECVYHAMVIGSLACLAWRRYRGAWVLGVAVWMSNPFSAVALHAAVIPWLAWRVWETSGDRRRRFGWMLGGWLAVNAIAAVYYVWFLGQWPVFQNLHEIYRSAHNPALEWWRMGLLLLPYGLGLGASVLSDRLRRGVWGSPAWRLFALLALVHIGLIQQSLALGERSMQAFHYNRGYLHLALAVVVWRVMLLILGQSKLLYVPEMRSAWWPRHFQARRTRMAAMAMVAVVMFSCMDNVLFFIYAADKPNTDGTVMADYARLARQIPAAPAPMLVLTEAVGMQGSYITAFTPHIAWQADETMVVPFYSKRTILLEEALEGKHGGVAGLGIDYAILYRDNTDHGKALEQQGWLRVAESDYMILHRAPYPAAGQNPGFNIR